jgi:hypothetical protein
MTTVISVEHPCPEWNRRVSKAYRLGQIGAGAFTNACTEPKP